MVIFRRYKFLESVPERRILAEVGVGKGGAGVSSVGTETGPGGDRKGGRV